MKTPSLLLVKASAFGVLGEYDHSFEFDEDNQFLIVYGPNGVGKTKFLEIIDALSRLQGFSLSTLPFGSANLQYSDGSVLSVQREENMSSRSKDSMSSESIMSITFKLQRPSKKDVNWEYEDSLTEYMRRNGRYEQISDTYWQDSIDGELIHASELRARFEGRATFRGELEESIPDEMRDFIRQVPSFLIETQRLRAEQRPQRSTRAPLRGHTDPRNADSRIHGQAKTIQALLTKAQTEHSRVTQQLDRTFPNRVLGAENKEMDLNPETIRARYNKQNEFRSRLGRVASVSLDTELSLPSGELDVWALTLLNQYLDDADKKLNPFVNLLEKIELLEQIINDRLLNKSLQVTAEQGLLVNHSQSKRGIALDSLSSGEQHEIILMIDLLFNVPTGALVLIDEPEISLHVAWQLAFIPDVRKIAKLAGFRFVVATHSPQIINDQWDRAKRLGPEEISF